MTSHVSNPFENFGENMIAIPIGTGTPGPAYFCVEQSIRAYAELNHIPIDEARDTFHMSMELGHYVPGVASDEDMEFIKRMNTPVPEPQAVAEPACL